MTYPIESIAHYILQETGKISTMKLQKLVYYCQVWSLAWNNKPLIQEEFEAWANGPVCPELYKLHKGKYYISANDIESTTEELSDVSMEHIDTIIDAYGDLEGHMLSQITHIEGPWTDARGGLALRAKSKTVIAKEAMMKYYKNESEQIAGA